jgi:predicted Rossmann-fold nucleotide-binding protein
MVDWIRSELLADGMISPEDIDLLYVTDDPAEAVRIVVASYDDRSASSPAAPGKADAE